MTKKRQLAIFDPQGRPSAQLTTLSYTYVNGHVVPEHFHNEHQLVFAAAGVMTIRSRQGLWLVPPMRAVWIPGGEAHSISMSGPVIMRTLYFSAKIARKFSKSCFVAHVSPLFRELILHACSQREWRIRNINERRIIEILMDQLAEAKAVPLVLRQPSDLRATRVAERLMRDPGDNRTLEALCKDVGGSKRTVERAFMEDLDMTFGKWRQQLRLLHAMRLLASGEKVTFAAVEAGYNSTSAFISIFKKSFGKTPNRYFHLGEK